jgi:hypothetical protein
MYIKFLEQMTINVQLAKRAIRLMVYLLSGTATKELHGSGGIIKDGENG